MGKEKKADTSGITPEELIQGMRPFKGESPEAFISRATDALFQLEVHSQGGSRPDANARAATEIKVRAILKAGEDKADRRS